MNNDFGFDWVKPFWEMPSALLWDRKRLDEGTVAFEALVDSLKVLVSGMREEDGKRWLHVSLSRPDRLPSWEDLRSVKDRFIGEDRVAVQVFPTKDKYVNFHPYVLHLWHCVDGDMLPDFTVGRPKGML